ncbi:MAG: NAD(P)H-dependent glycerol-3-phosphate dehydrogenase [Opitutaceae bacterium]
MIFTVVGAGAWGTAFGLHLARLGHRVALVPRRAGQAAALAAARENADYLPGIALPFELGIAAELGPALAACDVAFVACPAQAIRETMGRIQAALLAGRHPRLIVSLAKGLEIGSHLRPCEVVSAVLPDVPAGVLTGPTNAAEVARGLPAAMVLAVGGPGSRWAEVQAAISSPTLRVYSSDDVAGAEFGGALKNIYAIAAGCCDGLGLGDNAKAAMLTRALAEMVRVGTALGARAETFYGLSGFGDLVATCHGGWSRNREFGQRIGAGGRAAELIAGRKTVVEGYATTESFAGLCMEKRIDAPILAQVRAILFEGRHPSEALSALMTRGLKKEAKT